MIEGEEWKCAGYIGVPTAEDVKKYSHDHWCFIMELEHHAYPQKLAFGGFMADGDVVRLTSGDGMGSFFGGGSMWVKRTQIVLLALVPNPAHLKCAEKKPPAGSIMATKLTGKPPFTAKTLGEIQKMMLAENDGAEDCQCDECTADALYRKHNEFGRCPCKTCNEYRIENDED